jgi:hypothetical protein
MYFIRVIDGKDFNLAQFYIILRQLRLNGPFDAFLWSISSINEKKKNSELEKTNDCLDGY